MEVKASTQEHLDIEDIKDDVVILKDGGASLVIQTTSVNFDLLSEREQDAMILAFGNLLNSLLFPVQVIIRSKRTDISEYIKSLIELENKEQDSKLKHRINAYREFITELVTKNEVLTKNFYLVVTYNSGVIKPPTGPFDAFTRLFGMKSKRIPVDVTAVLKKAKVELEPKKEFIISELNRIGIKGRVLRTKDLIELFFDIYNKDIAKEQRPRLTKEEYTTPIVEPAIENG